MGSNHRHSLIARVRGTWLAADEEPPRRQVRERRALQRDWGIARCDHCGQTLVLGEPAAQVRLNGRDVLLCPECREPAPAVPTWIAAPARSDRVPVRLGRPQTELRRVA